MMHDADIVALLPEMSNRALFDCARELLIKPYRSAVPILLIVASECRRRGFSETEHALVVSAGVRQCKWWRDPEPGLYE
jgi:hypothetical protein